MQVGQIKLLEQFYRRHRQAEMPLRAWLKLMKGNHAQNRADLDRRFGNVDYAPLKTGGRYIFDIGGNKYRLVAQVSFAAELVLIRHVLTHPEYDRGIGRKGHEFANYCSND